MSVINAALLSSIGNVRGNNEDDYLFFGDYLLQKEINSGAHIVYQSRDGEPALLGVFDGMGGGEYGEYASSQAAGLMFEKQEEILRDETGQELCRVLQEISDHIASESRNLGVGTMGTTAAVLVLKDRLAMAANVGDSRIYMQRDGKLNLISMDHSIVYERVLAGKLTMEEARIHPESNRITRFLGIRNRPSGELAALRRIATQPGDRWMICSDGVSDLLRADQIQNILGKDRSPDETVREMVLAALELGGKDNATCIIADVK